MVASDTALAYVYAPLVIATSVILPVIASLLTGLRFLTRAEKKQSYHADDWLLVPAVVFLWGMGVVNITGVAKKIVGYPTPPVDTSDPNFQLTGLVPGEALLEKLEYAFYPLMILTFGLVKLAVIFFYRRLFVVGGHPIYFNRLSHAALVFSLLWTIAFLFAELFGCGSHFAVYWGPLGGVDGYSCVNGLPFLLALAATDFASDTIIFFMPLPLIWQLHTSTKMRLLVTGVLLLGAVSLVASIIRLALHVDLNNATYATQTDLYLSVTLVLYWSTIEAGLALIAINLPILTSTVGLRPVQSIVSSIRSVISLRSITRSQVTPIETTDDLGRHTKRNENTALS